MKNSESKKIAIRLRRESLHAVKANRGRLTPVAELADVHLLSLIQYRAVDGFTWQRPVEMAEWIDRHFANRYSFPYVHDPNALTAELTRHLGWFRAEYGEQLFGLVQLPTETIKRLVMVGENQLNELGLVFKTFNAYHAWYDENIGIPQHDLGQPLWPIILDFDGPQALQDGWHRFHRYVQGGIGSIPCLYYPVRAQLTEHYARKK